MCYAEVRVRERRGHYFRMGKVFEKIKNMTHLVNPTTLAWLEPKMQGGWDEGEARAPQRISDGSQGVWVWTSAWEADEPLEICSWSAACEEACGGITGGRDPASPPWGSTWKASFQIGKKSPPEGFDLPAKFTIAFIFCWHYFYSQSPFFLLDMEFSP